MVNIEIDIKFNDEDFIPEMYFITDGNMINYSCFKNVPGEWSDLRDYQEDTDTDDNGRTIFKHLIQCLKEGITFREYGTPQQVKIYGY